MRFNQKIFLNELAMLILVKRDVDETMPWQQKRERDKMNESRQRSA